MSKASIVSALSPGKKKAKIKKNLQHPVKDFGIKSIIQLEKRILDNKFDFETIQKLLRVYTAFVEFYDSQHDPIVEYFMEKMKILVSNQKALNTFANVKKLLKDGILMKSLLTSPKLSEQILTSADKSEMDLKGRKFNFERKMSALKRIDKKVSKLGAVSSAIQRFDRRYELLDEVLEPEFKIQEEALKERIRLRRKVNLTKSFAIHHEGQGEGHDKDESIL